MFAPIVLSAQAGVRSVSVERVNAALSLGATRLQLLREVVFPSACQRFSPAFALRSASAGAHGRRRTDRSDAWHWPFRDVSIAVSCDRFRVCRHRPHRDLRFCLLIRGACSSVGWCLEGSKLNATTGCGNPTDGSAATLNRRDFAICGPLAAMLASMGRAGAVEAPLKELRIGYQKTGALLVVKAQNSSKSVSRRKASGEMGRVPFRAAAAGGARAPARRLRLYRRRAADLRAGRPRESALCRGDSGARLWAGHRRAADLTDPGRLPDLKGKKIGVAKGSSAHNLLVAALESAEHRLERYHAASISLPRTRLPLSRAGRSTPGRSGIRSSRSPNSSRRRAPCRSIVRAPTQNSFFLVNGDFRGQASGFVGAINRNRKCDRWADRNRDRLQRSLPKPVASTLPRRTTVRRSRRIHFGPLSDECSPQQQAVADRFQQLG